MVTKVIIGCDGLQMTDGFQEAICNQYGNAADFIGTKAINVKLSTEKAVHFKVKVKVICAPKHNGTYIISSIKCCNPNTGTLGPLLSRF